MSAITIGDNIPRITYIGDGINKSFIFNFPIFEENNIKIFFDNKKQTANYNIYTPDDKSGGTIQFFEAPKPNTLITIIRELEIKRTTDFSESQIFRAQTLNNEFDYLVGCIKQITDNNSRCISLPVNYQSGTNLSLPEPEAGKIVIWDNDLSGLKNSYVNIESLDSYIIAAEETKESIIEAKKAINEFNDSITATREQIDLNTSTLPNKLNINVNNLTEKGIDNIRTLLTPDYASSVDISHITNTISFTAPSKGVLNALAAAAYSEITSDLLINGLTVISFKNGPGYVDNKTSVLYPVDKGDVIKFLTVNNFSLKRIQFVPYKEIADV